MAGCGDKFEDWRLRGWERCNHETLYPTNDEKFWGANFFKFEGNNYQGSDQPYIVYESPYKTEHFYNMIVKTNMRVLVNVSTKNDNIAYRKDYPLNLHFLNLNQTLNLEQNVSVTCFKEENHNLKNDEKVLIKYLRINNETQSYECRQLIYQHWEDGEKYKTLEDRFKVNQNTIESLLELVELTDNNLKELSPNSSYSQGLAVTGKYGFGRSPAFIVMFEIYKQIKSEISKQKNIPINDIKSIFDYSDVITILDLDANSFLAAMSEKVMTGAGEIHLQEVIGLFNAIKQKAKNITKPHDPDSLRNKFEESEKSFAIHK
ncbi:MAG: hypothetical protein J0H68_03940 [Sphingobacteriia bacterium]|nr:hypothetical protein [Sphingobacteriia bacterium]